MALFNRKYYSWWEEGFLNKICHWFKSFSKLILLQKPFSNVKIRYLRDVLYILSILPSVYQNQVSDKLTNKRHVVRWNLYEGPVPLNCFRLTESIGFWSAISVERQKRNVTRYDNNGLSGWGHRQDETQLRKEESCCVLSSSLSSYRRRRVRVRLRQLCEKLDLSANEYMNICLRSRHERKIISTPYHAPFIKPSM